MRALAISVVLGVLGVLPVPGQDLPQWVLQLSRIKRKARAELERLPNFACVETIHRFQKAPRSEDFTPIDTIRLEVAFVADKELFAPVGGGFREMDLTDLARGGAIGTGSFSAVARNLFVNDNSRITGWTEERLLERPALRYDFVIPEMFAGYTLERGGVSGTAGLEGAFWADADSLELLRVEQHAVDIPPNLGVQDSATTVTYAKTRIGASDVLLPRWAELVITSMNGWRRRNAIEFTGCREYVADSVIHFDTVEPPVAAPRKKP